MVLYAFIFYSNRQKQYIVNELRATSVNFMTKQRWHKNECSSRQYSSSQLSGKHELFALHVTGVERAGRTKTTPESGEDVIKRIFRKEHFPLVCRLFCTWTLSSAYLIYHTHKGRKSVMCGVIAS